MAKILITGGSGLIGRELTGTLKQLGHEVSWLSRSGGIENGINKFEWDINKGYIDPAALIKVEHIIHLAGSGIMDKRWTTKYKREIISSRVDSSKLIYDKLIKHQVRLKTFTGASAVGYYGQRPIGRPFIETDRHGDDFLASVCKLWEESYVPFINRGIKTTIIRTAIVLSEKGGALEKLKPIFKAGLGSPIGTGQQAFPWIHIKDLAKVYIESVVNPGISGVYNTVTGGTTTNRDFCEGLASAYGKKIIMPAIPEFALKLALGERATALVNGAPINNQKLKDSGISFEFNSLGSALSDVC
jgi:uncharacterized protein